ncbi:MAG: VanZ family protein [Acidobacteriota bacterium]
MPGVSLQRRAGLWLPPLGYMATIYGLSAQSDPMPAVTAHVWDKFLHAFEYGALAILVARALMGEGLAWLAAGLAAIVLASLYGGSDEYHQFFVPGRSSDVHDWVADTIGAAIGTSAYLAALLTGLLPRR